MLLTLQGTGYFEVKGRSSGGIISIKRVVLTRHVISSEKDPSFTLFAENYHVGGNFSGNRGLSLIGV